MDRTQMEEIEELISVDIVVGDCFEDFVNDRLESIQSLPTPLPVTEQNYLDLAIATKEIIAEKDEKMVEMSRELTDCKLMLYKVYGLCSFVSEIMNGFDSVVGGGVDDTMQHNLEFLNSELEKMFNLLERR